MVDMPHVPGPGAHLPPAHGKKSQRIVDTDKFQQEMRKKVEKVSETDSEQKKKRKHKQEAEDETEGKEGTAAPPKEHVTPFSLEGKSKKVSPLEMDKGSGVSPLKSAQPTKQMPGSGPPSAPQAPLMQAPPPEEEAPEDLSLLEIPDISESFGIPEEETPAAPASFPYEEPTSVSQPEITYNPVEPERITEPTLQSPETTYPEQEKPKEEEKKQAPMGLPTPAQAKPQIGPPKPKEEHKQAKGTPSLSIEEEKGITAEEIETPPMAKSEETGGFFEQFVEKEKPKKEMRPGAAEELEAEEQIISPITPLPASDYLEQEKKEEEEVEGIAATAGQMAPPAFIPAPEAPAPINPYTLLHPEVMDLFDKMVGVISVMSASGVTETVVTLNAPKFASSVFFGAQIIIHEYKSAPLAYNIQINGTPEALSLFQGNAQDLMAAFQYGNYAFRVNRLETGLLAKPPLVRRKEPPSGGKQDQKK
ncbi:MAG TPA: hypothetical protein VGJ00_05090 [Rhabdochlamydiaceae bacterium]|jgi:hypothetical protein